MTLVSSLCVVGGLAVSGCKVGPNFKPSDSAKADTWAGMDPALKPAEPNPSTTVEGPADITRWWTVFGDERLTSLIDRAAESNLDVAAAEARLREARATRDVAASGLYPTVNLDASATRSRAAAETSSGRVSHTGNNFRVGFDASWEIDVFGGVRRGVEATEAGIVAAVEDQRDVRVLVLAEVAATYMDLRGAQQNLAIAHQNLASQRETANVTRQRFEAGFVSGLDVANSDSQVASTLSTIPSFEASIRASAYALGVLLGQEPAALLEELTPEGAIPLPPAEVPVGLPSELLRRRPDIRRAEADLHQAVARIGVAEADLYPRFSLTGSLGLQSGSIASLGSIANHFWSIGPSMSWPIFQGGQIRANIRLQEALADETGIAYRRTVLVALQDVETSLVNFSKEQERRKALEAAVAANIQAVDLATQLYEGGRTDFLNVLTAQRSLFISQSALVQSNVAVSSNLVSLYKALGGGWEEQSEPPR